jgi:LEA14-like dessication related protein
MLQEAIMSIRHHFRKTLVLATTLAIAGCAVTDSIPVAEPTVRLSGVRVTDIGLSGQTFLLSFDVSNPNPFPLPVRAVRYHVALEQQTFVSGESPGSFSIPADGNGAFDLSVKVDLLQSAGKMASLLRGGIREPIPYEMNGSLAVDIPFVKPLPFSASGLISID